jgi:hypothetical protein
MDGNTNATADPAADALSIEQLKQIVGDPARAPSQLFAILRSLRSDDDELKGWANDCLQTVTAVPANFVPELTQYCSEPCVPVAAWACKLLGRQGADAREWQDVLVQALESHASVAVRQSAAAALGSIPGLSAVTIQALTLASQADDARLKRLAVQALEASSS